MGTQTPFEMNRFRMLYFVCRLFPPLSKNLLSRISIWENQFSYLPNDQTDSALPFRP